jgi:hypothetical protein
MMTVSQGNPDVTQGAMPRTQRAAMVGPSRRSQPSKAFTLLLARWSITSLLIIGSTGCSRHIEEDPPIPAHRYEPSETWCAMLFDPQCPLDFEVETEEECFEEMLVFEVGWAPVGEDEDACAATFIPYIECMASLPCEERHQHFELLNMVPIAEVSSCGGLNRAQLDCQSAHYP